MKKALRKGGKFFKIQEESEYFLQFWKKLLPSNIVGEENDDKESHLFKFRNNF